MTQNAHPPPSRDTADAIRHSFTKQGLMRSFGATIDTIAAGRVILRLPITAAISQQHGFAHAGATFALGDSAAGYAALSLMAPGAEVLTIEMKINLIAPAKGLHLVATGTVVKAGRRLTVVRAEVEAEDADETVRTVAILQGTMIPA